MRVYVILNPYANRWQAKAQMPLVQSALADAGVDHELVMTTVVGEGIALAERAASDGRFDAVVAAGGDSTVNEVVNGLVRAAGDGPTRPLGVLPLGTGNDFADMTSLPRHLGEGARVIAAGRTRAVDVAHVGGEGVTGGQGNGRYFDNNSAAAMEPMVTIESLKMKRLSGNIRYVVALARALLKLKAWTMTVTWDDGRYEGPVFLLSVCNSARTGGVFQMAPGARMDDGRLNFVLLPEVSRARVLALLPGLFSGKHVDDPRITFESTTRLRVTSRPGTPVHADGEVIAEAATRLDYTILPGKLTLLALPATDK